MKEYTLDQTQKAFSLYDVEKFGNVLIIREEGNKGFSEETKKRVLSSHQRGEEDAEDFYTNIVRIKVNGADNIAEYDVLSTEGNVLYTDWVYIPRD